MTQMTILKHIAYTAKPIKIIRFSLKIIIEQLLIDNDWYLPDSLLFGKKYAVFFGGNGTKISVIYFSIPKSKY